MSPNRNNHGVLPLCAALVALLLVLAACTSDDDPVAEPDRDSSSTTGEAGDEIGAATEGAQERLDALIANEGVDGGAAVLTVIDGETTRIASGTATDAGDPLTPDHQFRVGSISKPFVATIVLQLAEEGLLELGDPLSKHLPDTPVAGEVTIEQLLSHRSGVPDYTEGPALDELLSGPLDTAYSPADAIELIAATEPGDPGGPFSYSNTNYILLGQLVETVDQRSLNEALGARITKPLGLDDTFFAGPDAPAPTNLAGAWDDGIVDGDPAAPYATIETLAWSAGSLVSTADDLAAFMAGLRDGELLDAASFDDMVDFESRQDYGLGLGDIVSLDGWPEPGWGHTGGIPGYLSFMASTDGGDSVIILTNDDTLDPLLVAEAVLFDGETPGDQAAGEFGTVAEYLDGLEESGYEGIVLIREGEGETVRSYGLADREAELAWDATTVFDIGSITKQFTGAAIVRLEMDGLLTVDDTLADHLDGLPPEIGAITLHELLTHTAGFPGGLGDDYEPIGREDYIARAVDSYTGQPGEAFSYSNTGYSFLGAVIETVTGDSYEVYLHQALFEPAGMTNTGYVLPDWSDDLVAVGYDGERALGRPNDQIWDTDGPYWHLRANGGILSTVEDMMLWHEALLTDDILDESAKEKFFGMHVAEDAGSPFHYGYGWTVAETPDHGTLITHNGGNGIFFADFLRFVDEDITIFVATNNAPGSGEGAAVDLALAALGTDPFAELDPGGGDEDAGDGGGYVSCTEDLSPADVAALPSLNAFPDTAFGETLTIFFELLANSDEAARREFVTTRVLTANEMAEDPGAVDDVTANLGRLADEHGDVNITRIVEVDPNTFVVTSERPGAEPRIWAFGTAPQQEALILCWAFPSDS